MLQSYHNFLPKALKALYKPTTALRDSRNNAVQDRHRGHPASHVESAQKQGNRTCHMHTQHIACLQVRTGFTFHKNYYCTQPRSVKGLHDTISPGW